MNVNHPQVEAGVEWLNEKGPAEWWTRIDLAELALADGDSCILGQVFAPEADETGMPNGYFYAGDTFTELQDAQVMYNLGFIALTSWGYEELDRCWRLAVKELNALASA